MSSAVQQNIYSLIVRAQQMDCQSNYGNAFVLYLDGINALTVYLKTLATNQLDAIGTQNIDYNLVSGVNTLKNCTERLESIANNCHNNNNETIDSVDGLADKLETQSLNGSDSSLNVSNSSVKSLPNDSQSCLNAITTKTSTNLQKAYKDNRFLSKIFETRLRSTIDVSKRASLKLELQRRITENLELAKRKDKELFHSLHLRERKALELAAKKLLQQQNVLNLENESMIVDNQSQQQLYAQILDFESKHLDLSQQFRCQSLSPEKSVIDEIITKILQNREHPLSEWIDKFQVQIIHIINPLLRQYLRRRSIVEDSPESIDQSNRWLNSCDVLDSLDIEISDVESEALIRHFNNITSDISVSHETITLMLTLILFDNQFYYKPSNYELFREQHYSVHSIVSKHFYPPIWSAFRYLFRIAFHRQELELRNGIQEMLENNSLNNELAIVYDQNLIEETAQALREMLALRAPFEKLRSMVRLTQNLCLGLKSNNDVSADDLVPALCEVVLKSGSHQLISECTAIEQLVDQKYLMGEEGYCLSSVLTALKYIQMHSTDESHSNQ